jgi:hypothetical protein
MAYTQWWLPTTQFLPGCSHLPDTKRPDGSDHGCVQRPTHMPMQLSTSDCSNDSLIALDILRMV